MQLYELIARFDSRKSFYHKALVKVEDNGIKTLLSYETPVARVSYGKLEDGQRTSASAGFAGNEKRDKESEVTEWKLGRLKYDVNSPPRHHNHVGAYRKHSQAV